MTHDKIKNDEKCGCKHNYTPGLSIPISGWTKAGEPICMRCKKPLRVPYPQKEMNDKIKKPEKKYCGKSYFRNACIGCPYLKESNTCNIYEFNKLNDDYEKFLPSEEEIRKIILNNVNLLLQVNSKTLAKSLSKRIRGEK